MTDTERAYGTRLPTGRPARVAEPRSGWPMVAVGVLTALAALAPWVRVDKIDLTRTGLREGPAILALGLVVAACGALVVARRGAMAVVVVGLVAAIAAALLTVLGLASADVDTAHRHTGIAVRDVSVQWGYYLTQALVLACCAAAVLAFLRRASVPRD